MPIIVTHNGNSLSATAVFLKSTPTDGNHATTKAYVDGLIANGPTKAYVDAADTLKANITSPTFTGTVLLPATGTNPKSAVTKEYVDARQGLTQSDLNLAIDAVEVTVDAVDAKIDQKMPLYTNLPTNQIGDLSYLDLDIKGDYKGAQSSNYEKPYVVKERNGNFVGIRGGYNGIYHKQFYFTSPTDEFLADSVGVTDIEYKPKWLAATEYVSNLIDGNSDGFCVTIRNTGSAAVKYYWIRVNGTMDASKHTFTDLTTLFTTSRGTGGSETFSAGMYDGESDTYYSRASVVYCPEKNYWIATKQGVAGTVKSTAGEEIWFYIFNKDFTQLGTFLQTSLNKDIDYGSSASGGAFVYAYTNHTNRPNIQYDYDQADDILTITNIASLTIVYTDDLAGGLYNSACTFNCNTNTFASVFPLPTGSKYTPNATSKFTNPQAYQAPFFSTVPTSTSTNHWDNIKLRKFYNIGDGIIIETAKDYAWEPTRFNIIKHTLNEGKTWKDFILNPYANGDEACSTYGTPGDNAYGEQLQYVDDASLLGKEIRCASFISPNRIFLKAQSKTAGDAVPVRRRVIAKIDNINSRQKILNDNDSLASPSGVVKSTLSILDSNQSLHTVIDSSGNMRVRVLDGAVFKEINCDTGIGADGSPSTASITNANVFTLPTNYTTLISNIVKTDSLKIGLANKWRGGVTANLGDINWIDGGTTPTNFDWHIYHLKTTSGGATFLLVYGYYSYDAATTTGTVRSCYKILNYSSSIGSFISGTGTQLLEWTALRSTPVRQLCNIDLGNVEAAGGSHVIGNTMTCGIYDDGTYISCIFKGIGAGAAGINSLPTAAIKVQISNGSIVSKTNNYLTNFPTWHTESPCIHPTFGPCIVKGHEVQLTRSPFIFVDNISTSNLATRMNACFTTLFNVASYQPENGNTSVRNTIAGTSELCLLTLQAAQGFNVYTSEIPVFMNGSYYKIAPTAYNTASIVSTLGATVALPKSLYVYVELVNSAPILIFNKTFIPNTATLTYVGEIQTDGVRIIYSKFTKSSDFTGANQDIVGTEGYQKLPGGLILQWGKYVGAYNVTFGSPSIIQLPIAFPSTLLYAGISEDGHSVNGAESAQMDWTTTGKTTNTQLAVYIACASGGTMNTRWFAIGY